MGLRSWNGPFWWTDCVLSEFFEFCCFLYLVYLLYSFGTVFVPFLVAFWTPDLYLSTHIYHQSCWDDATWFTKNRSIKATPTLLSMVVSATFKRPCAGRDHACAKPSTGT